MPCKVTITRMWMVRPFQTRSRHWDTAVGPCTEVTKEGCNAPGWITEQGKTLALGSGRISCQNPEVMLQGYKPQFEQPTICLLLTLRLSSNPPPSTHTQHAISPSIPKNATLFSMLQSEPDISITSTPCNGPSFSGFYIFYYSVLYMT